MTFQIPPRLAWHVDESDDEITVYLMALPGGAPLAITGVSALIWLAAAEGEDPTATVAQATGEPIDEIRGEVDTYLLYLIESGFLERTDHPGVEPR